MSSFLGDVHPDIALPNETLAAIFRTLPSDTLGALACVSHRFNAIAERELYSSVHITDFLNDANPEPRRTLRWCEAMYRRVHLVDVLKKLHIRWQAESRLPSSHLIYACERIAEVVRKLTPLESLELFLGPINSIPPPHAERIHPIERILRGCQFHHLQSCSLGADWTKGGQTYTSTLQMFLASLTTLRHLKISDHHSALDIPADSLPHLSAFRGSADAAASLLPGRPVQYLALIGLDSDMNRENLPRMSLTTLPLRYLDMSAMSIRPTVLRNVSTYLHTVESLRVRLALRHTLHYSMSGIRLLAGLSSVLSAFDQLACIDLSPTEVDGVGTGDSGEEFVLCKEWGKACPSLKRIIFPSQTNWLRDMDGVWVLV